MPLLDLYDILQYVDPLNILRILVTLPILAYSCMTDWKIRRAPNELWYLLGGIGVILNLVTIWLLSGSHADLIGIYVILLVAEVVSTYILVYLLFNFGGFGGADAKALIAIAIMFPLYPLFTLGGISFPLIYSWTNDLHMLVFFWLAVLGNAVVLTIIVPAGVLVYNLLTIPPMEVVRNPLRAIIGYKAGVDVIGKKHLRLMHDYSEDAEGKVTPQFRYRGKEPDEATLKKLKKWRDEKKIDEKVWVTPKLPFLIPITLGFVSAVLLGNILMLAVSIIVGPS